jgi:hypothetical protein
VIHPLTPLEDLERFFDAQAAAAAERNARRHAQREEAVGSKESTPTPTTTTTGDTEWDDEAEGKGHEFALVTDTGRKWVLAVATRNDLDVSTTRAQRNKPVSRP